MTSRDFRLVRQHGLRIRQYPFYAYIKSVECASSRLGVVISKRQIRHAVRRNRVRRQLREWFRLHLTEMTGIDCVVVVTAGADGLDNARLRECLSELRSQLIARCKSA